MDAEDPLVHHCGEGKAVEERVEIVPDGLALLGAPQLLRAKVELGILCEKVPTVGNIKNGYTSNVSIVVSLPNQHGHIQTQTHTNSLTQLHTHTRTHMHIHTLHWAKKEPEP